MMTNEVEIKIFPWHIWTVGKESKVILTEKDCERENMKQLFERTALKIDGFGAIIYDVKCRTIYDTVMRAQNLNIQFE